MQNGLIVEKKLKLMISVVVSYNSNEQRFIESIVNECVKFSDNVIISAYSTFFDGQKDDKVYEILSLTKNKKISVIISNSKDYETIKDKHNGLRFNAMPSVKHDYVLFLDGDEIPNGDLMRDYLSDKSYKQYDALSFRCYWYFREAIYQATRFEECGIIVRSSMCNKKFLFHEAERWNFTNVTSNYVRNQVLNEEVIIHHYSWVRSKEEMLRKVKAWGHTNDKNWVELIEQEFEKDFDGKDFIHNYSYNILQKPLFNIK
jgi:hypothetical protein